MELSQIPSDRLSPKQPSKLKASAPGDAATSPNEGKGEDDRIDISEKGRDLVQKWIPEWAGYHRVRQTLHDALRTDPALTPDHVASVLDDVSAGVFQTEGAARDVARAMVQDLLGQPIEVTSEGQDEQAS